ncbi:NfeD family protein [Oscillospiraceae bacterium LTW-04]|nr:NfeD family protein [Oscillospiraceae bacterium MB24-C1]
MMGILITLSRFMPLTWLLIAIALGVMEAVTIDLVAIWFALGALVTIIPAAMGLPFWMQLIVFLAVSLVTLFFTRPIAANVLRVKKVSTNADRIIGMIGVVTHPINNIAGEGRVLVNGLEWSARSDDGAPIPEKENVLIKAIEGVKVIVERVV